LEPGKKKEGRKASTVCTSRGKKIREDKKTQPTPDRKNPAQDKKKSVPRKEKKIERKWGEKTCCFLHAAGGKHTGRAIVSLSQHGETQSDQGEGKESHAFRPLREKRGNKGGAKRDAFLR